MYNFDLVKNIKMFFKMVQTYIDDCMTEEFDENE